MLTFPHTQIFNATKDSPLCIPKYPMFFGSYCPHIFWHETAKHKPHRELVYSCSWNVDRKDPNTGLPSPGWNLPKIKSAASQTICLLFLDSDPASMNNGLPIVKSIKIDEATTLQEIFDFSSNPNYTFSGDQKAILMKALLQRCTSDAKEFIHLNNMWSYYHNATIPNDHKLPS